MHDFAFALRTLRRSPGFAAVAVLSLALGIGATTTVYAVVEAVLLRPLPFPDPDRLVMLWSTFPDRDRFEERSAYANVADWQAAATSFDGIAVFDPTSATLTGGHQPERVGVMRVSPNAFELLGATPELGRAFDQEESAQRQRVAIASHELWQRQLGATPETIGASLRVDGESYRIVGVLPGRFRFPLETADLFVPHTLSPDWESVRARRGTDSWFALARLRPAVALDEIRSELRAIMRDLERAYREANAGLSATAVALPGVAAAGTVNDFFHGARPPLQLTPEDTPTLRLSVATDAVGGRYFQAIGASLLAGRLFAPGDHPTSTPVAVVNETLAGSLWPGLDPLGRRFKPGPEESESPWLTVVGVVADMRRQHLEQEPVPQYFRPHLQTPSRFMSLLVRSPLDPGSLVETVRAAVRSVDPDVPVYHVSTLEDRLGGLVAGRRFQTFLLAAFSCFALTLAAVGIYGIMSLAVNERRREIGIRAALGATRAQILELILGRGLRLSAVGILLGLVIWLAVARALAALLYEVSLGDPLTLGAALGLLLMVALAASWMPARRASRVCPIEALRGD